MQPLQNVSLRDDRIFKLDFRVAMLELIVHFGIGNESARRNQRLQLAHENVVLLQRLKLIDRHVVALNKICVLFLPNEFAIGKKLRAKRPMLKVVAQLGIVSMQTQPVRLRNQHLLFDELLRSLTGEHRHQHGSLRSATGKLPLDHLARHALHFGRRDLFVAHGGENTLPQARQSQGCRCPPRG